MLSVAVAMSAETHVPQPEGAGDGTGPTLRAPVFNPCYKYAESVNPMFDPRRVLLRRNFFMNEVCSKYVSVGYYRPAILNPSWSSVSRPKCPFVSQKNMCGHSQNITLYMRGHVL